MNGIADCRCLRNPPSMRPIPRSRRNSAVECVEQCSRRHPTTAMHRLGVAAQIANMSLHRWLILRAPLPSGTQLRQMGQVWGFIRARDDRQRREMVLKYTAKNRHGTCNLFPSTLQMLDCFPTLHCQHSPTRKAVDVLILLAVVVRERRRRHHHSKKREKAMEHRNTDPVH